MIITVRYCVSVAKGVAIVLGAYFAVTLLGLLIAHAAPDVPPAAVDRLDMTRIAAWIGAVYAIAHATLKVLAPLTKTKRDDEWLARLESLEGIVHGRATSGDGKPE